MSGQVLKNSQPDYRQWHLPLARGHLTLAEGRGSLAQVAAMPGEIPLMVQLVENPRYRIPGIDLFHGRVELARHDAIHLLLGRGLLNKDEGFTIGFTMGSTRKVSTIEEELFVSITTNLYPYPYRFGPEDIEVFRDGLRLAYIMRCEPLDQVNFAELQALPLEQARQRLGIDTGLLKAYYVLEKKRFPDCPASRRLLDK